MKKIHNTCTAIILAYLFLLPFSTLISAVEPVGSIKYYRDGLKPLLQNLRAETLVPTLSLSGSQNETLNFTFQFTPKNSEQSCFELDWVSKLPFKAYQMKAIQTRMASYRGAHVGAWLDPLIPLKNGRFCTSGGTPVWLLGEFSIPKNWVPGQFELPLLVFEMKENEVKRTTEGRSDFTRSKVLLKVWDNQWADEPSMPLYSELTTWYLLLGHHGKWAAGEQELSRLYINKMIENRIIPIKHWIKAPHDLTATDQREFQAQVSQPLPNWAGISAPNGFNRTNGDQISAPAELSTYYSRLSRFLQSTSLLARSFLYYWDEPDAEALPVIQRRLPIIKRAAPDLKVMVTTTFKPELARWVDIFAPVLNQFDLPHFPPPSAYMTGSRKSWLYVSCMSHGCDSDDDAGTPDFVIDRGEEYIRSFAWIAQMYYPQNTRAPGVNALLYYSINNGFRTNPGVDPWDSQWDFSGNGDGTLFYPGRPGMHGLDQHMPIESLRLKIWRQASYDSEYLIKIRSETTPQAIAIQKSISKIVKSPIQWSKTNSTYQEIRTNIGNYLDQRTTH